MYNTENQILIRLDILYKCDNVDTFISDAKVLFEQYGNLQVGIFLEWFKDRYPDSDFREAVRTHSHPHICKPHFDHWRARIITCQGSQESGMNLDV